MNRPAWITFDCYDTLVEFPVDDVTREILGPRADGVDIDQLLADFESLRYETTTNAPYQPYRDVLRGTLARTMREYGRSYRDADGDALLAAVPTWGPYPDVPPALERLREHFKLAIITNSDDDLMARNGANIGVPFDRVITAEQARAYKPSPVIFTYALRELGSSPPTFSTSRRAFATTSSRSMPSAGTASGSTATARPPIRPTAPIASCPISQDCRGCLACLEVPYLVCEPDALRWLARPAIAGKQRTAVGGGLAWTMGRDTADLVRRKANLIRTDDAPCAGDVATAIDVVGARLQQFATPATAFLLPFLPLAAPGATGAIAPAAPPGLLLGAEDRFSRRGGHWQQRGNGESERRTQQSTPANRSGQDIEATCIHVDALSSGGKGFVRTIGRR